MAFFDGHIRGLGKVPIELLEPLKQQVEATPTLWEADADKPNKFSVFRDNTVHAVFQYPADLANHRASYYTPLWLQWQAVLTPIVHHVTGAYGYAEGRTARIMLARLKAGASIPMHIDSNPSAVVPHKIHVPLWTNKQVHFLAGKVAYHLRQGIAYEVNNRVMHGGVNKSTTDRIHLIFDYYDAAG